MQNVRQRRTSTGHVYIGSPCLALLHPNAVCLSIIVCFLVMVPCDPGVKYYYKYLLFLSSLFCHPEAAAHQHLPGDMRVDFYIPVR